MASVAPPKANELQPASTPAQSSEPGPAAKAARERIAAFEAAQHADLQPDRVLVRLDPEAQRFVSTLTDSTTAEMLRRYPSEAQLAYSRAVMAYLRAQMNG
jgi:hypothetical protein